MIHFPNHPPTTSFFGFSTLPSTAARFFGFSTLPLTAARSARSAVLLGEPSTATQGTNRPPRYMRSAALLDRCSRPLQGPLRVCNWQQQDVGRPTALPHGGATYRSPTSNCGATYRSPTRWGDLPLAHLAMSMVGRPTAHPPVGRPTAHPLHAPALRDMRSS